MALDIDYLKQAKQFLQADAFGQDRPPGDTERAIAYALVAIGESFSKLIDGQGIALMGAQITPVDPGVPVDTRTDEQRAEQDAATRAMLAGATYHVMSLRIEEVRGFCERMIEHDRDQRQPLALTDRAWACQSVLNILDGNIDDQLRREAQRDA